MRYLRRYWFSLSLGSLFLVALALRLWGLDRFNFLIFDEIYYAEYAVHYLTDQPVFDAHPPLAKYLMALGIWLGENILFRGAEARTEVAGMALSPWSFRWLNAVVGASIPLLIAGITLQLTRRRTAALLAGVLATAEGYLLLESRVALLHVYLVAFGLLGQWCFLRALGAEDRGDRQQWLLNAGLSFGACVSIKWNGLGYWLVPMLVWFGAWVWSQGRSPIPLSSLGKRLREKALRLWPGILCLTAVPAAFYAILWLPHLRVQTDVGLATVHQQILGFHQGMNPEAGAAHPYCSPWWSWPLVLRPMAYLFRKSADGEWRYSLHALGNPVLWWLTTGAIALLMYALVITHGRRWLWQLEQGSETQSGKDGFEALARKSPLLLKHRDRWVAAYLLANYVANWLPWMLVKRCTFIYHHLGALCFGIIAVAFWCDRWLQWDRSPDLVGRYRAEWRWGAVAMVGAVLAAFVFWLPMYLGLPLSELGFKLRIWLPTWI